MSTRFRKLRIAFSAMCLIACVLLIALWARSYWWEDMLDVSILDGQNTGFYSERGVIGVGGNLNPVSLVLISEYEILSAPTDYQYPIQGWFGFSDNTLTLIGPV